MKQRIGEYKEKVSHFWQNTSKKSKGIYIGTFLSIIAILSLFIFFTRPNYIPLYPNSLSQKEVGEIKAVLERQGFTDFKITNNGTQIQVPDTAAPDLIVNLASEGLPKGGTISFRDQTKDLGFGATDRELEAIEREVIQGQLANLMSKISGVSSAEVMITLPKESVFIRPQEEDKASASIIINLEPGHDLEVGQVKALYHLASKSIPNLPEENIVITDQYGQMLTLPNTGEDAAFTGLDSYETQRKIKQKVEADIQRSIQQMLGTMLGQDKVLVQAFVKMNFDKVKTHESIVEPINKETNEGIAISVEKVTKSYSGEGAAQGGIDGVGETDVPGYAGEEATGENNEYEEVQNRVNYEVNRITREIVASPFTIEDLTINVGVEPPDPNNPESLTVETQESIKNIISNVVQTAIGDDVALQEADINNRITVFPREFAGKSANFNSQMAPKQSQWLIYILLGAIAVVLVIALVFVVRYLKRNKKETSEPMSEFLEAKTINEFVEAIDKKESVQTEINDLAGKNTEEFVELLRYWLKEEKEGKEG